MKLSSKLFFLILLAFVVIQPVSGQSLLKNIANKAKQKMEKKMEEKTEKKIDEKIDTELDKVEESLENNEEENAETTGNNKTGTTDAEREAKMQKRMQGFLKSAGISGEPVAYNDTYNFDYLIQMHIESHDKSGKSTSNGEFITHLNPKTKSMAYQVISGDMAKSGQGMFIVDADNGAMIILSNEKGEKSGIVYGMSSFLESLGESYEEDVDLSDTPETYLANPNVKKTGKSKTIAGYKCDEYLFNDEESESEFWITKDLKMNTQDFFSTLFKTSLAANGMGWGYMMEATSIDKSTGEKSIMKVTKVDKNSNTKFNLSEYQITNLGSINLPQE